jgi:hypothetical protein
LKGKTLDFFPRGKALKQSKGAAYCETLVPAMLETLDCIEREDAECAFEGYAQGFTKLHNGVDTETEISGSFFWSAAFNFLDFKLDYDHVKRVAYDLISVRYVETITLPNGVQVFQHEHALVTVDADYNMTNWDQYGDNVEQDAVWLELDKYLTGIGATPVL